MLLAGGIVGRISNAVGATKPAADKAPPLPWSGSFSAIHRWHERTAGSHGMPPLSSGSHEEIVIIREELNMRKRLETRKSLLLSLVSLVIILTAMPLWAANTSATNAPKEGEAEGKSLTELNKGNLFGE